jgi:hypothetical protein
MFVFGKVAAEGVNPHERSDYLGISPESSLIIQ